MNKQILRLAIPSILANITIPLVGLVDTAIVGHISDAHAIGGIAIGTMLFDLLYWNFGFLRVGTSGMTAQAFGRGDREQCARLLAQSVGIALIGAALIWLLQWLFVTAALAIVPCSAEVASFARDYFFVRVWAAPATLSLMAIKGWFIGMQDTVSPMITDMVVNVVNMAVSYALAVYTPLGALGVAYGTVVAQFTGLLLSIVILMWKYRHVWLGVSFLRLLRDMRGMRQLISLNANLFVRSLCFMIVYVGFTSLSSLYGDTDLAVCSILMKLFMLFSYFVDGFAYAGEALVGKYIGAAKSQPLPNSPQGVQYPQADLLAGLCFQQELERLAFAHGSAPSIAPAQRLRDFVEGRKSSTLPACSYLPGVRSSSMHEWLPEHIGKRLQQGFRDFDRKYRGFLTNEAVILGVESRSSSAVRIPRDPETLQSISTPHLYPCGEGAGYAGGITSSALDGINAALKIAEQL